MVAEDVVFRAVAHPVRRELLGLLAKAPRSVKEMTAAFDMSQPAISQHLKELREAELVSSERVGVEQRYRLTPKPLKHVLRFAERYRVLMDPAGHMWGLQRGAASVGVKQAGDRKKR